MARIEVEKMWKIMKENNFQINDDINPDCVCRICKQILIDACNGPCGCRYCKQCIKEHLSEGRTFCPGTSEYCKNRVIDIDRDICIDQPINIKISKLEVKCPNITCESKIELKAMENHLRICEKRSFRCPYFDMGCAEKKLLNDKVAEHLLLETGSHTKLLMEWISNSQNDSESLKKEMKQLVKDNNEMKEKIRLNEEWTQNQTEDMKKLKSENNEIKKKMERSENLIRNLHNIQKENTTEINNLGEEMSALKNNNRSLKNELQAMKNISNSESKTKMETQNEEIDKLNDEWEVLKEISQLQFKEIDQLKQKCEDIVMKLDEISRENNAIKSESEKTIKSMEMMREIVDQSNHGEFIWRIENWTEILIQAKSEKKIIYSDQFFTHKNGFKMSLELHLYGHGIEKGVYLGLFFRIWKGPFDDIYQWPFKHDVELSLINQLSGLAHSTKTVKYSDKPNNQAYIKPIEHQNIGFGKTQFIKLEEISSNPALRLNNQIFIKCTVKCGENQNRRSFPSHPIIFNHFS